ncbi:MAG: AraC family transcriptional regulator [Kiritimatiellae bacterium]|nr:AraC family transcriptional regulator [Kiritimatiellia bacterium]
MNNDKLNKARQQIKPICFDSIKIVVTNITETNIPEKQRLKILPSSNHEIITIFKGSINCKIDGNEFAIQEKDKDIIFLPNNRQIICTPLEDTTIFRIQIIVDSAGRESMQGLQNEINTRISESGFRFMGHWKLCRLFEKIKTEISNSYPFSELKISLLIQDFILTFLRIYFAELNLRAINTNSKEYMEKVDMFIESNINNKISARDLAEACRLSTRQTARIIQKNRGQSPSQYIKNIKMEIAKNELLYGKKSIKEIASALGYNDLPYFYRCFHQTFKTSPKKLTE